MKLQFASPLRIRYGRSNAALTAFVVPRGGEVPVSNTVSGVGSLFSSKLSTLLSNPSSIFDFSLAILAVLAIVPKIAEVSARTKDGSSSTSEETRALQIRFLPVFWLLRCAYWMSGPYVYAAYKSKTFGGIPASLDLVSKIFLTGYASMALFGPAVGQAVDTYGRKRGTLAFALFYGIGLASIKSGSLPILYAGRAILGIGLSLLFCAPEAWLAGEASRPEINASKYLGETFSLAFVGDSIVAIIAGKLAGVAANVRGPTGPFELSIAILATSAVIAGCFWRENIAHSSSSSPSSPEAELNEKKRDGSSFLSSLEEAVEVVQSDRKIALLGAVQIAFESAMNIWILQWPPAMSRAVASAFGTISVTPFGSIFSCFMACSLLGSSLFGRLVRRRFAPENFTSIMMMTSALSMGAATFVTFISGAGAGVGVGGAASFFPIFVPLTAAFFIYEACVGMYFPSMATLRSKYIPDAHKSAILTLFGIPLNAIVAVTFLSAGRLGVVGSLGMSFAALVLGTGCMIWLQSLVKRMEEETLPQ